MTRQNASPRDFWLGGLTFGGALALYLLTAPRFPVSEGDQAEFTTLATVGGIAHAPGYPTYLLLSRLTVLLLARFADPAALLNGLSGVFGALAAAGLFRLARLSMAWPWASFAAGLWVICPQVWTQMTTAEVYAPASAALFWALFLGMTGLTQASRARLFAAGLLVGLGFGLHYTTLVAIPLLFTYAVLARKSLPPLAGKMQVPTLGMLCGLSTFLYLPFSAHHHPAFDFSAAGTGSGFLRLVEMADQSVFAAKPFALDDLIEQAENYFGEHLAQFPLPATLLGLAGWLWAFRKPARPVDLGAALLFMLAGPLLLFALHPPPNSSLLVEWRVFYLPAHGAFALLVGAAANRLASEPRARRLLPLFGFGSLAALGWMRFSTQDQRQNRVLVDYGANLLDEKRLSPGALLFTCGSDVPLYAVWYQQFVLHRRADVAVVHLDLAAQPTYRRQVRAQYPSLPEFDSVEQLLEKERSIRPVFTTCTPPFSRSVLSPRGLVWRIGDPSAATATELVLLPDTAGWDRAPPGWPARLVSKDAFVLVQYIKAWLALDPSEQPAIDKINRLTRTRPWLAPLVERARRRQHAAEDF